MSLDPETIEQLQSQLAAHQRRLAYRLRQQAWLGAHTTPEIAFDIEDATVAIQDLTAKLREAGVALPKDPIEIRLHGLQSSLVHATLEQQNRTRMLQKVHNFWIKGVLENSLHGTTLLTLGLQERQDAVARPWKITMQQYGKTTQTLPANTSIVEVFDDFGGELLILGTPGSGKTTLLLELGRELLARANSDISHPIPVILNLSSWSPNFPTFVEWLVNELNRQYDVPPRVAQAWINDDQVLPLLDSLDEVRQGNRTACIVAINAFRKEHGFVPLIISSRVEDYEALTARLKLQNAVLIQPLTIQQIDVYLESIGEQLTGLRNALTQDASLRELAESPLMLSIMGLAYQGVVTEIVSVSQSAATRRKQLFEVYIERMLARRDNDRAYSHEQIMRWLASLAQGMQRQGWSVFLIERLQPDWLYSRLARLSYVLLDRIGSATVAGLLGAFGGILVGSFILRLLEPQLSAVLGCLMAILIVGLFGGQESPLIATASNSWRVAQNAVLGYLAVGIGLALGYQFIGPGTGVVSAIGAALIGGTGGGVAGALTGPPSIRLRRIVTVDKLRWSWPKAIRLLFGGLILGLLGGLGIGLLVQLGSGILSNIATPLSVALGNRIVSATGGIIGLGLVGALAGALMTGVAGGIAGREIETKTIPNQGIRRSFRNAVISGVGIGLTSAAIGAAILGFSYKIIGTLGNTVNGLVGGALFGLFYGGLLGALTYGGYACISHIALRLILWRSKSMPLNCDRFLDYCADRILLRKVGGGYIFIHRLLLEYFATLELESPSNSRKQMADK